MITLQKTGAGLMCLVAIVGFATVAGSQEFSRVAAKVVDEDGNPLKGALVTVTTPEISSFSFSKKTNKRGQCIVTFSDGTVIYDFTIEMEGYQTLKAEVRPTVGTIDDRVFTLAKASEASASTAVTTVDEPAGPMVGSKKARRYNEGVEAQQAGDLETAMAKFLEATEADPEFAPAFTGIATVAMEQGNYQEAAEAAEKAVTLDPGSYRALQLRYDAYRKMGDEKNAAAAAKALKQAGDISEATGQTFNEAIEAANTGNLEVAKSRFRQALDLDPELVAAYSNLAQIYMWEGDAERAAEMADEVLRRRPDDLPALKIRYEALNRMGVDDAAKSVLAEIVEADPEWASSVLFDIAQQLFNANQFEEARTVFEQILTVQPDHPESHYLAGLCCNSSGDAECARLHLTRYLELAPDGQMAPTAREILKYLQ